MNLQIFRLLFDFGLVVLIWLVQLVIYPGMSYYSRDRLIKWHKKYTVRITFVVVPLMTGQFLIAILQFLEDFSLYTIGSVLILITLWGLTFLIFVPLHNSIVPNKKCDVIVNALVRKNKIRTALWTLLFLWSFLHNLLIDYI